MLNYSDGTKIPKWFGDFGGNLCLNDTDFPRIDFPWEQLSIALTTEAFEKAFRDILEKILPCSLEIRRIQAAGRTLRAAPALAGYYSMAGHLALAVASGAKQIFIGTYSREMALCGARACNTLGLPVEISLGRELCDDEQLCKELEEFQAKVDRETTKQYFDLPYGKVEAPFSRDPDLYSIPVSANYGIYPKPGLTGILAGLYGEDLKEALGEMPEFCIVPVETGLEAVGAFKALKHTKAVLCTSEETVAQEFHGCDTGTYTIIKKYADQTGQNITLCPELVSMWREGRVLRRGCDRILPLDTQPYCDAGLSKAAARAAALAAESGYGDILVLEKEVQAWNG